LLKKKEGFFSAQKNTGNGGWGGIFRGGTGGGVVSLGKELCPRYAGNMKTAASLSDTLFEKAEQTAIIWESTKYKSVQYWAWQDIE
jgi:hypothetical protein